MLLHVVDRVGRPINQVSLSFIKPETSEGDFMFFPQIFWENTQFYLRPFFFFNFQNPACDSVSYSSNSTHKVPRVPNVPISPTKPDSNNKSYCEFTFSNDFPTHGPFHVLSRVGRLL